MKPIPHSTDALMAVDSRGWGHHLADGRMALSFLASHLRGTVLPGTASLSHAAALAPWPWLISNVASALAVLPWSWSHRMHRCSHFPGSLAPFII